MNVAPTQTLDPKNLPDDLALLKSIISALIEEAQTQRLENDKLRHQLYIQINHRFGRRSEGISADQMALFQQLIEERLAGIPKVTAPEPPKKGPARPHGRRKPPENLPTRTVHFPLPDDMKLCPECNAPLKKFGEESRIQINWVPASIFKDEQVAEKWCCPACQDVVVTSPLPPLPIKRGMAGAGLLAHIAVSKFADHIPLSRQTGILNRHGFEVNDSTLGGWMGQLVELVEPIVDEMKAEVLKSKVIHSDDTPVSVREKRPIKPPGQDAAEKPAFVPREHKKARQARLWVYVGDKDHPYTVYDYSPNREGKHPVDFLGTWSGYFQVDAYGGYDALFDPKKAKGNVTEVACGAHVRRYFEKALPVDSRRGQIALAFIEELYKVEKSARGVDAKTRRELRQKHARPIFEKFKAWIDEQAIAVLPKSAMGEAFVYACNQWEAWSVYLEDGDLSIDNNVAERTLRSVAVGRNNWGLLGTDEGGRWASVLYSITASCKRHSIDPFAYLNDVIPKIIEARAAGKITNLLPIAWAADQAIKAAARASQAMAIPLASTEILTAA
jgi:transposase